ncbi:MAG: hypothetical protein ACRC6X_08320 [Culicoidibacterales bacterium]
MYVYYKIKNKKHHLIIATLMLCMGIIAGVFFTYSVYIDSLNLQITINAITKQDISIVNRVIDYLTLNSGLIAQIGIISIGILVGTRPLWGKLFDKNSSYFLQDFRYAYYSVLQYVCFLKLVIFFSVGIAVLVADYRYFPFVITSYFALSAVIMAAILFDLLLVNFTKITWELKMIIMYLTVMSGFYLAFTFAQSTIMLNFFIFHFFTSIAVVLHCVLIDKIRRNQYAENK